MSDKMLSERKFKKAQGDDPVELFDFIYRDARRIESLYARLATALARLNGDEVLVAHEGMVLFRIG